MSTEFWYGVAVATGVMGWVLILALGLATMVVRKRDGNDK